MVFNEMNDRLRAMLQLFNDELKGAGWEVEDFNEMFLAGMSVSPEGTASRQSEAVTIEVNLCLPECELQVFILDRKLDKLVRLVLASGQNLREILACLVSEQDQLDTNTFPQFLLQASRFAKKIWFVDHEGTRLLLEFPDSFAD